MLLHDDTHAVRDATVAGDTTDDDAVRVRAAVAALTPLDREALLLRVPGNRTLDQIAEHTRTTNAMVRVRLHRAAVTVQDNVGPDHPSVRHGGVADQDRAVEDAELGITPGLTARLDRALRRTSTPEPRPVVRRLQRAAELLRR